MARESSNGGNVAGTLTECHNEIHKLSKKDKIIITVDRIRGISILINFKFVNFFILIKIT
tara:strand:- start:154 stop:333 length:180 start_codon:yes stop_codon:yes gene_type:complete